MNSFFKVLIAVLAVFGAAIGALAVLDRIANKNRIKGDYLECETESEAEEPEEETEME